MPLLGHQIPRILYSPTGDASAGEDAIELAAEFGLILDPWQQLALLEGLKERPEDGKWASYEVGVMVSRQNGKGSILEALELAGLFLFGEQLIIHSAHEFKTAADAMRRLDILLCQGNVKHKAVATHGQERVEILAGPAKGARVMFQSRTKGAGLGFSADRLILDEAMMISPESYQALLPTLISRPNPQIWLTGSAVDQRIHVGCEQFAGVRARAMNETGKRLTYLEWSVEEDAKIDSREAWWQANPGGGIRISEEDIEAEYESFIAAGGERAFGVQRLGIGDWPLLGVARSEISPERWQRHRNVGADLKGSSVLTLYRAPEGGAWSITGAQRTVDGRIHVETGYTGHDPADVVVRKFIDAIVAWGPCAVIVGRGGAAAVAPELEAAGVEPVIPNLTEEAQACGGFLNDTFIEGDQPALSHSNQAVLNAATANAVKRELPSGGFVWDRVNEATFSPLMGATLSRWALLKYGGNVVTAPQIHEWPTDDEIDSWLLEDDDL